MDEKNTTTARDAFNARMRARREANLAALNTPKAPAPVTPTTKGSLKDKLAARKLNG